MYIVKNKHNGKFLAPTGVWTERRTEALQFPNGLTLVLHLEGRGFGTLENDLEVVSLSF
jgi:hypothetical protein